MEGSVDTVVDRKEYEVLGRLVEGPAISSSPELGSGAARFLPLMSLGGSLMVRATDWAGGFRRGLLLGRKGASSDTAFDFDFPAVVSLERVTLTELLVERVTREDEGSVGAAEEAADGCCSSKDKSRSLPLPLDLLLSFAAFTLALERRLLDSVDKVVVIESICGCDPDALELLVAS